MATAATSYTFTNGTTADGPEVSTNFSDLVSFLNTSVVHVDGTKSMTGILTLPASDPVSANQATRKSYVDAAVSAAVPPGALIACATVAAPTGWLLCYGQAVSRTTYAALFAAISTSFGSGDGSSTFNVPDLRGRIPVGGDAMGGSDAGRMSSSSTMGTTGGDNNYDTASASTGTESQNHTHSYLSPSSGTAFVTGGDSVTHTHTYTKPGTGTDANLPPFIVTNWIIKT